MGLRANPPISQLSVWGPQSIEGWEVSRLQVIKPKIEAARLPFLREECALVGMSRRHRQDRRGCPRGDSKRRASFLLALSPWEGPGPSNSDSSQSINLKASSPLLLPPTLWRI